MHLLGRSHQRLELAFKQRDVAVLLLTERLAPARLAAAARARAALQLVARRPVTTAVTAPVTSSVTAAVTATVSATVTDAVRGALVGTDGAGAAR